jgi:hypothetical protein
MGRVEEGDGMKALAIHAWARVFESNIATDSTVGLMLPMKRGTGYAKLVHLEHGAAVYGVWISLLQIALGCVPRGTLVYTDGTGMKAHDDETIALVTGFNRRDVAIALPALLAIGWLETVETTPEQLVAAAPKREKLEDLLKDVGARLTFNGESLLEDWYSAVKGLGPKRVREIFEDTTPGITMPSAFIRARRTLGR